MSSFGGNMNCYRTIGFLVFVGLWGASAYAKGNNFNVDHVLTAIVFCQVVGNV